MKNIFVITYVGNPKNFDIVRVDLNVPRKTVLVEAEMLATSEKKDGFHSDMPAKKFFSPAVWKQATPVDDLRSYSKQAQQKTKEFQKLLIQQSKEVQNKTTRKINWR